MRRLEHVLETGVNILSHSEKRMSFYLFPGGRPSNWVNTHLRNWIANREQSMAHYFLLQRTIKFGTDKKRELDRATTSSSNLDCLRTLSGWAEVSSLQSRGLTFPPTYLEWLITCWTQGRVACTRGAGLDRRTSRYPWHGISFLKGEGEGAGFRTGALRVR